MTSHTFSIVILDFAYFSFLKYSKILVDIHASFAVFLFPICFDNIILSSMIVYDKSFIDLC